MQILNISVMNRPARNLTSKPYGVYIADTLIGAYSVSAITYHIELIILDAAQSESIQCDYAVSTIGFFSSTVKLPTSEVLSASVYSVNNIVLSTSIQRLTVAPESVMGSYNIGAISLVQTLIKHKVRAEAVAGDFRVSKIELIK
ncbi:hypothetical protein [Acinetobacter chinensis]|uniref:hypothetical protein n=1 Tax=Acinetobacter chinensis TaxID=2004650 RepID=UPI0029341DA5|nr:hypothetical protein [Acinetobacter chinensis]WOE40660.1 hypothetical protein QSG87_12290 [Acinetobacter chinensis]